MDATSPQAVCFCLAGGIINVTGDRTFEGPALELADYLEKLINRNTEEEWTLAGFNDNHNVSHSRLMLLLTDAERELPDNA